jgi:hypothetical protein
MVFQAQVVSLAKGNRLFSNRNAQDDRAKPAVATDLSFLRDHFSNLPPTSSLDGRLLTVTRVSCEGLRCVKPSKGVNKKNCGADSISVFYCIKTKSIDHQLLRMMLLPMYRNLNYINAMRTSAACVQKRCQRFGQN